MKKLILLAILLFSLGAFAQTSRSVSLTWNDTQNPTGTTYNVYRASGACSTSSTFTKLNATAVSTLAYSDTAVTTGNTYCYQVTAVNGGLESVPSNQAGAVIGPFAPTGLTVTVK